VTEVCSPPLPTSAAVAIDAAPAPGGHGAASGGGRTPPAAGRGAPSVVLGLRARTVTEWMRRVELAEAEYASLHRRRGRLPGWGSRLSAAFEALAKAVAGLRAAWQLFRLRAVSEGVPWQKALMSTVPGLFGAGARQPDGLRQDTAFSYAVVQSAEDVAACFLWRLERGYC
jgi:hypothetical protein